MVSPARPSRRELARRHAAAVQLLIACVRVDQAAAQPLLGRLLGRTDARTVLDLADVHRVAGLVHARLSALGGVPRELVDGLRSAYESALRQHLRLLWELKRLAPVLDATGARWVVVKGPVVAELLYEDPGHRSYADIDVLVEPGRFDQALEALRGYGARLLDRNWTVIRREMRGELHFTLPDGALLDLHWDLVNMYRGLIRVRTGEMLDRRRRAGLGGVQVPALDPTDQLIHLCLHGTLSGGDRLVWMSDVARASLQQRDWDELVRRSTAWQVAQPVGYMLWRAESILGAPVPGGLAEQLLGSTYTRLLDVADRVAPWHRPRRSLLAPGLILTRSMGFGPAGTAGWLLSRTLRGLDPREPAASEQFSPRGSTADYEAYVRAVLRTAGSPERGASEP